MISYLIIFLIIISIQLMLLGILLSNLELDLEECDVSYNESISKKLEIRKLKVNIKLYLFKKINVLKIKIYKDYCEIFKLKIHLNVLKKLKDDDEFGSWFVIKNIGKLDPKIKDIKFDMTAGTESTLLTTFLIPIFSTVIFSIISKNMKESNEEIEKKRCDIKIIPRYVNTNNFSITGKMKIYFDTMKVLFFIKKHRKIKI